MVTRLSHKISTRVLLLMIGMLPLFGQTVTVSLTNNTYTAASPNLVVGNSYTIFLSSPFPYSGITSTSAQGTFSNFATTDSNGNWTVTTTAANPGTYSETYSVSGVAAALNFTVLASLPTLQQSNLSYPNASPNLAI